MFLLHSSLSLFSPYCCLSQWFNILSCFLPCDKILTQTIAMGKEFIWLHALITAIIEGTQCRNSRRCRLRSHKGRLLLGTNQMLFRPFAYGSARVVHRSLTSLDLTSQGRGDRQRKMREKRLHLQCWSLGITHTPGGRPSPRICCKQAH